MPAKLWKTSLFFLWIQKIRWWWTTFWMERIVSSYNRWNYRHLTSFWAFKSKIYTRTDSFRRILMKILIDFALDLIIITHCSAFLKKTVSFLINFKLSALPCSNYINPLFLHYYRRLNLLQIQRLMASSIIFYGAVNQLHTTNLLRIFIWKMSWRFTNKID